MKAKRTIEDAIEELKGWSDMKGTEVSIEYKSKNILSFYEFMMDQIRLTESVICDGLLQGKVNRRYLSIVKCMREIVELLLK